MDEIFIPTLHTFAMKNSYTGSCGAFRFRIVPDVAMQGKEVDFENSTMTAQFWHGPFCYEKSETEGEKIFPLSAEGREEMISWLIANV